MDLAFVFSSALLCLLATAMTLPQTIHGVPHAAQLHLRGRILTESSSHGHGHEHEHDEQGVSVDGSGGDDKHGHGHGPPPPVHVRVPGGYIDVPGADITPSTPLTIRVPGLTPSSPVHVRVPEHKSSPVVVRVPPQEEDNHAHGGHEHHD